MFSVVSELLSVVSEYYPTLLGTCQHAIDWSEKLAEELLTRNMNGSDASKAKSILKEFSDHKTNKSHARHISKDKCSAIGVTVIDMESDNYLQDLVLTTHHAFMHTFGHSKDFKNC